MRRGVVAQCNRNLHHEAEIEICRASQPDSRHGATANQLTKGMAAAQLRLLRILPVELHPDGV